MAEPSTQESVQIYRAGPKDKDRAWQIVDEYCNAIDVVVRETQSDLDKYFADDSGIWLAECADETVGCVALRPLPEIESACEVKRLYVRPEQRGQQIADKLMHVLHAYAAKLGYRWCYLDTKDDLQAAIRLYERLGYSHCERYNDNPQATVFMRRSCL